MPFYFFFPHKSQHHNKSASDHAKHTCDGLKSIHQKFGTVEASTYLSFCVYCRGSFLWLMIFLLRMAYVFSFCHIIDRTLPPHANMGRDWFFGKPIHTIAPPTEVKEPQSQIIALCGFLSNYLLECKVKESLSDHSDAQYTEPLFLTKEACFCLVQYILTTLKPPRRKHRGILLHTLEISVTSRSDAQYTY